MISIFCLIGMSFHDVFGSSLSTQESSFKFQQRKFENLQNEPKLSEITPINTILEPKYNMSSLVGAEYTPWRAGNQLWWHNYSQYRKDVVREIHAIRTVLGFSAVRVFLHDLLWDADSKALIENINDFLSILDKEGMRAGFVFFDDCWSHSGANVNVTCMPIQGIHNGCWMAAPQDVNRKAGVDPFKGYVSGLVAAFQKDLRVAWWEIFNEPQKHNLFSISLRDAGFRWAKAENPIAPVISCWDNNNDTEVVDTHQYSVPRGIGGAVFSNVTKGGIVTEAGCRWYKGTHDYGSPLTWIHWLEALRKDKSAPFIPGVMLSWEVMVGHSMTRWHWGDKLGSDEPLIPWCGSLYPDGTPVSFTEAAATRRYLGGKDDFLFFANFLDVGVGSPEKYLILNTSQHWDGWSPTTPPAKALYELAVWPDSGKGNLTVTAGNYNVSIIAFSKNWDCKVTQWLGCYNDKPRIMPTAVSGGDAQMSYSYCGSLCKDAGFSPNAYSGVEYANECWCTEKLPSSAVVVNETECNMPCAGNKSEMCGGVYKMGVFKSICTPVKGGAIMQVTEAAPGGRVLAYVSVKNRLVNSAWNILRILSGPDGVKIWLNPTFADITGASVPPADEQAPPHPPHPLLVTPTLPSVKEGMGGLRAWSQGGVWHIDYASVLPGL